ncbi:hypothetical protein BDK51DRAFT_34395, partial [Blyttiomyces helicus]
IVNVRAAMDQCKATQDQLGERMKELRGKVSSVVAAANAIEISVRTPNPRPPPAVHILPPPAEALDADPTDVNFTRVCTLLETLLAEASAAVVLDRHAGAPLPFCPSPIEREPPPLRSQLPKPSSDPKAALAQPPPQPATPTPAVSNPPELPSTQSPPPPPRRCRRRPTLSTALTLPQTITLLLELQFSFALLAGVTAWDLFKASVIRSVVWWAGWIPGSGLAWRAARACAVSVGVDLGDEEGEDDEE